MRAITQKKYPVIIVVNIMIACLILLSIPLVTSASSKSKSKKSQTCLIFKTPKEPDSPKPVKHLVFDINDHHLPHEKGHAYIVDHATLVVRLNIPEQQAKEIIAKIKKHVSKSPGGFKYSETTHCS